MAYKDIQDSAAQAHQYVESALDTEEQGPKFVREELRSGVLQVET